MIQSIDMSPTVLVLVARRLLTLRCRPNTPESSRMSATTLVVDTGSVEGDTKGSRGGDGGGSRGVDVCMGVGETSGGRGGTAGGEEVRRDGPIRERSRLQLDCEPRLSGEPERGPDSSLVNSGRGALCGSGTEKGIGSGPKWLVVAVSVIFALIAASILPLGRSVGERRRTRVGARPWPRTTET
jgi:hypothetical protein